MLNFTLFVVCLFLLPPLVNTLELSVMAHTTLAGLHCNGDEFKKVCNTALAVEVGSDDNADDADDCIRFCVRSDVV